MHTYISGFASKIYFKIKPHSSPHTWLVVDWNSSCLLTSCLAPLRTGCALNSSVSYIFAATLDFRTLAASLFNTSEYSVNFKPHFSLISLCSRQN